MTKKEMNTLKSILHDYFVFNQLILLMVIILLVYVPLQLIRKIYSDKCLNKFIDLLEMSENRFIFKQRG